MTMQIQADSRTNETEIIHLETDLGEQESEVFKGQQMTRSHYDRLITTPARVYKPNGDLLLHLCRDRLSDEVVQKGWKFIDKTSQPIVNRRSAAGAQAMELGMQPPAVKDGKTYQSNTVSLPSDLARQLGSSAIAGYFDRYARTPFCRQCAVNQNYPQQWKDFQPFVQAVDATLAQYAPDRYRIQRALADATDPAWVINGTAFTTVTINRNFRTAAHQDAGDCKDGFGVMAYLQIGSLAGGYLVIPRYRIAVQLQHKDIVLFDVHEYHGNTVITKQENAQRITLVFYYRENMLRCGTPQQEIDRSKTARIKGALYDKVEIDRACQIKQKVLEANGKGI